MCKALDVKKLARRRYTAFCGFEKGYPFETGPCHVSRPLPSSTMRNINSRKSTNLYLDNPPWEQHHLVGR